LEGAPYPGITQALAEITQAGARIFVATSKRTTFARRILDHFDLTFFSRASMAPRRAASSTTSPN
jgi:phosphoglycolate phosphatase